MTGELALRPSCPPHLSVTSSLIESRSLCRTFPGFRVYAEAASRGRLLRALTRLRKALAKAPLLATFAAELVKLMIMKPVDSGSVDTNLEDHHMDVNDPAFMY